MFKKDKKEYLCHACVHCNVCMFKNDYMKAQDKVDSDLIDVLVDNTFIKPVKLECNLFIRAATIGVRVR